jgi:hypothetical protein
MTLLIAFPVVGILARSWATVSLPLIGWPLYYLGLNEGWWGLGTGDGWQFVAVGLTVLGVASTGMAVAAGKVFWLMLGSRRPIA